MTRWNGRVSFFFFNLFRRKYNFFHFFGLVFLVLILFFFSIKIDMRSGTDDSILNLVFSDRLTND